MQLSYSHPSCFGSLNPVISYRCLSFIIELLQYIQISLDMNQQNNHSYTRYLQNLLIEHNIQYESEQSFKNNTNILPKQFPKGPLQTNLQPPLLGNILPRYSRQMLLKQLAYDGQLKICKSKIALIGAGGIGCPLGLYLAGAGVGTLGIFDGDQVEINNLHRQIGHMSDSIGKSKTGSLRTTLHNLNPNILIREHPFITKQTLHLLDEYDLVIDGSDNPLCRYLVNDYLMSTNKKLLSGACVGWQGQLTCYGYNSPCYRCIWGNDQLSMGGCATLGVIGMLPGVVGTILALQAIRLIITGLSNLQGYLLTYQAKSCTFRKIKLRTKKQSCEACGHNKLNIQEYNYNKYIVCANLSNNLPDVPCVTWSEIIALIQSDNRCKMVDVRQKSQFQIINFKKFINIPYDELISMSQLELQKILEEKDKPVFISCKMGIISKKATEYLIKLGYKNTKNIEGGINMYGKLFDHNIVNF